MPADGTAAMYMDQNEDESQFQAEIPASDDWLILTSYMFIQVCCNHDIITMCLTPTWTCQRIAKRFTTANVLLQQRIELLSNINM